MHLMRKAHKRAHEAVITFKNEILAVAAALRVHGELH
jgi:hypothetical protein